MCQKAKADTYQTAFTFCNKVHHTAILKIDRGAQVGPLVDEEIAPEPVVIFHGQRAVHPDVRHVGFYGDTDGLVLLVQPQVRGRRGDGVSARRTAIRQF